MKKIRILVAEDTKEARDLIIEGIKSYAFKKFNDENYFFIEKAESFSKGLQLLTETDKNKEYFDIFFADIDFTEDKKGGQLDSGFKLIERAFEVCPITKIYTYSAQYKRVPDLRKRNEELVQRGLVVFTMDKSEGESGEEKWLEDNLDKIYERIEKENWLWDLWENHNKILEVLRASSLSKEAFTNLNRFNEINSNLETILLLLQRKSNFNADVILSRLILQLYHRNLEIFITGDKSEDEILSESDRLRIFTEEFLRRENLLGKDDRGMDKSLYLGERSSSLRKLIVHSHDYTFKFGYLLNKYRNKSVHPGGKFFPELASVIFANLTFTLYVLGNKKNISTSQIESLLADNKFQSENKNGLKDLKSLIEFIKR